MENKDNIYLSKQRYDFTIVDNAILRDKRFKIQGRMVYWILNYHTDQAGTECFPSLNTIAKEAGVSKPAVTKAIADLVKCGYITKKQRKGKDGGFIHNEYTILVNDKNKKT